MGPSLTSAALVSLITYFYFQPECEISSYTPFNRSFPLGRRYLAYIMTTPCRAMLMEIYLRAKVVSPVYNASMYLYTSDSVMFISVAVIFELKSWMPRCSLRVLLLIYIKGSHQYVKGSYIR